MAMSICTICANDIGEIAGRKGSGAFYHFRDPLERKLETNRNKPSISWRVVDHATFLICAAHLCVL